MVDLALQKSGRQNAEEIPEKYSIPNHSSNENSKDLMNAAQEELMLASLDQERRNVRSS